MAGEALLKRLRVRSGLTQTALANRSGVSERTIRGIEMGRIHSPRSATLVALASGMRLLPDDAASLLKAWDRAPELRSLFDLIEVNDVSIPHALTEASIREQIGKHTLSQTDRVVVGADRRVHHITYDLVVRALRDGVDDHLFVKAGDQSEDARCLRLTALAGCRLKSHAVFPEVNTAAFTLSLGTPASAGDLRTYSFRVSADRAPDDPDLARVRHALGDSDGYVSGLRHASQLRVEVSFVDCAPTRLWEIRGTHSYERVRETKLDEFGKVCLFLQDTDPDNYGFEWAWD